jgi:hypothetical protein
MLRTRGAHLGANPGLAETICQNRASASPLDYVTYCTNCRDILSGQGKRAFHLLDLLFLSPGTNLLKAPPGLSARRENRRRLRARLGNAEVSRPPWSRFQLPLSPELTDKMNRELILLEDLQQILAAAEESGTYLHDETTGCSIAHHTHGITTYWMEYERRDGGFLVRNLYSHHMAAEE